MRKPIILTLILLLANAHIYAFTDHCDQTLDTNEKLKACLYGTPQEQAKATEDKAKRDASTHDKEIEKNKLNSEILAGLAGQLTFSGEGSEGCGYTYEGMLTINSPSGGALTTDGSLSFDRDNHRCPGLFGSKLPGKHYICPVRISILPDGRIQMDGGTCMNHIFRAQNSSYTKMVVEYRSSTFSLSKN